MQNFKRCFRFFLLGSTVLFMESFFSPMAMALPIDWKGSFGVNTTLIDSYRRTTDLFSTANPGSQFIEPAAGNHKDATFQNYIFHLDPSIIVNDSISLHGEISSGYNRGGFLGDSSTQRQEGTDTFGNALYLNTTSNGQADLSLSKIYMELFTDTATFLIGRQPAHWGLGAIWNSGPGVWDRFSTTHDGLTAKFKIGNFHISPHYTKINSTGTLTKASSTKSYGFSVLYDNIQRDLTFGLLFDRRQSGSQNDFFKSGMTGSALGRVKVKLTDLFFKKTLGKFTFGVEVPLLSGDLGNVYGVDQNSKYKAQGIIAETRFHPTESWTLGLDLGTVSGDNGQGPTFNALYLNPNYQIANLMFRYNLLAVKSTPPTAGAQNIYDSYIVNTKYLKLYTKYTAEAWTWKGSLIYAKADETAQAGTTAFNHATNKSFLATVNQEGDLGYELDLGVNYQWNPNLVLNGDFGYHFVGEYFEFTNGTPVKAHNSYVFLAGVAVQF